MVDGDAGRVVGERFELREPLGGPGRDGLWRARDRAVERDVVVKRVPLGAAPAAGPEPGSAARTLAGLSHPHLATVLHLAAESDGSALWVVWELAAGRTLADRLAEGPLPPADAATLGRQLLSALRAAHAAGLCHGDLRPEHVLLHPDGGAVLTGFRLTGGAEADSPTAPEYLAPERIRGGADSPAADLWSLGVLLYVCVEGHHPLRRPTALATAAAVLDGAVPPPARAGQLGPVLKALLVQDPVARPSGERLDGLLAGGGAAAAPAAPAVPAVPAAPPAPAPPAPAPPAVAPAAAPAVGPPPPPGFAPAAPAAGRRRSRWVVAATATAVAVVAAGTVYAVTASSDDDGRADDPAQTQPSPSAEETTSPPEEEEPPSPEDEEPPSGEIDGIATLPPEVYRYQLGETSDPVPYEPSPGEQAALSVTVDQVEPGEHADLTGLMDPIQSEGLRSVAVRVTLTHLGGAPLTLTSGSWVGTLGTFGVFDEASPTANNMYAFGVEGEPGGFLPWTGDQFLRAGESFETWVVAAVPEGEDPTLVYWKPDWDPLANGWLLWETG
ncbi:serine/threonine-protein kinase [Streptomyces sp. DSM 44915]|uniref:non-specific serine/threonine protein kinase n=1 Tax=Streptomyces chisholmiae TaxID=3075540 RepID=A0ABU2JVU4_9ACTN|nr:serine/threonine-protein kinase [Streptomyces sp. DSM 44915]MDT0269110.1 serine/threonine-protein kinase [Streptomyces sp. DSM 44915]